jgi:hypothetical protein
MPTPSTWQTSSVQLKRAGDPDGFNRVAGLEIGLRAPAGSWPMLTVRGGARSDSGRLVSVAEPAGGTLYQRLRTIPESDLGQISVPGQSVPTITESSAWEHVTLSYASQFDATLSRLTAAMLLEGVPSSLRMCGGTVATKRVTNGTTITETATQTILPKYVAYHTAAGYQIGTLSSTSIGLTGMDQPWLLVWWGNQSHWVETTKPLNYAWSGISGSQGYPQGYAFQADCPLLLVFENLPTSIVQTSGQGGFDLGWALTAGKIAALPLYGRSRQVAATTEAWSSGLPSPVQTQVQWWQTRLTQYPRTVAESHAYTSGTDTATITETITWTQVRTGGTKLAPLPPVLGIARATSLAGLAVSGPVVDGNLPTEYGPSQGVEGVNSYSWTLAGLAAHSSPRPAIGSGTVPASVQARLDAAVDALIAQPHWQPWHFGNRIPDSNPGGDVYWSNAADSLALASELVPLVSGSRQTSLKAWLATERTNYPPETAYNVSATAGTARGPMGTPGSHAAYWSTNSNYQMFYDGRQWLYAAWALARYYQVSGTTPSGAVATALVGLIDSDMAEQDWATGSWFAGIGNKQTAVESHNRHWAGLCGLAWICQQASDSNEGLVRALLAKSSVTRVAMAHLPRWLAGVGLLTYPTDLGASWQPQRSPEWTGFVFTNDFVDSSDDPRVLVHLDQYRAYLDDTKLHWSATSSSYLSGNTSAYAPAYRSFTRPLASLLAAAVPGDAEIYSVKYRELQPHWWVPFADAQLGGEQNSQHPADSHGVLLSRAWLEGVDADTLAREAAFPWLVTGGDLFAAHKLAEAVRVYTGEASSTAPVITSLTDNRASYTGSQVPLYSPLVFTAQIATVATNTILPYDVTAPFASDGNVGITVDLQVSTDLAFGSYQTRPYAWIENYSHTTAGSTDQYYPLGTGQWQAGWLPETSTGTWYLRTRVEDAGGVTYSSVTAVTVTTAQTGDHGPVQRSSDSRYYQFADGTYFSGAGLAFQPQNANIDDPIAKHGPHLAAFGANKVQMARIWASSWAIWGDNQPEWISANRSSEQLYGTPFSNPSFPMPTGGPEYGVFMNNFTFPLIGFLRRMPAVKASTTYRLTCRYAIDRPLTGPLVGGDAWGFGWKLGTGTFPLNTVTYGGETNWVYNQPGIGTLIGGDASLDPGPTPGNTWQTKVFGDFTTGASQTTIPYLVPVYQSTSAPPPIWIAEVYLQEVQSGGVLGPNLIGVHPSDFHKQINQRFAVGFDAIVQQAEAQGIVLKIVMLEKNQYSLGVMATDGRMTFASWNGSRVYGSSASLRQRWYHRAVARYYAARWGYSPTVMWEFVNEGDPASSAHFQAAEQWGNSIKVFANPRLCSTSTFGNSYPYNNWVPTAPSLDGGDIHFYLWSGFNSITTPGSPGGSSATVQTNPSEYYDTAGGAEHLARQIGAQRPFGINRPTVRGETGLLASSDTNNYITSLSTAALGIMWHKLLWSQIAPHGVIEHYWHTAPHVYDPTDNSPNNLAHLAAYQSFISTIPLSNGRYVDAAAGSSSSNVRAWGQKDLTANRFHVWLDNKGSSGDADDTAHNWRTVQAGLTPTARSATITVPGLGANVSGTLYRFDPYAGTFDAGTPLTIGADGVASISLTGLSTDTAFSFVPLSGPPPPPGSPPANILAAAGINSVTVSWAAPTDWTTSITSYEVEVTNVTVLSVTTQSTPNVLVWPVTGLSSANVYTFRVRAYSGAVVGGYSLASQEVSPVALGGYLKDQVLNWFKGTDMASAPANVYWSLHTGDPGKTGASEVSTSGTAYARKAMATSSGFSAIADGTGTKRRVTNAGAVTFNVPTASWGTVAYAGAWDALTSGNFLGGGVLAQSAAITVPQDAPHFNASQLAVELD